jgi:fatty aldehyde-generating acyl-ACP reductase
METMADKHGFRLAGFRSFERAVTPEQIERVAAQSHARTARGAA